jgi:hypothetical protein
MAGRDCAARRRFCVPTAQQCESRKAGDTEVERRLADLTGTTGRALTTHSLASASTPPLPECRIIEAFAPVA